jgi:hypothetical protein
MARMNRHALDGRGAVALDLVGECRDGVAHSHHPVAVAERGSRVGEHLCNDALGVVEGVAERERRPERLPADEPAFSTELGAQLLEGANVGLGAVAPGIVWRGRTAVAPKLDDDRPRHGRQCREVRMPERAAREDAVDAQPERPVPRVRLVVEPVLAQARTTGTDS